MPFGEVHDVDVVAHARAVGRRVVVAEDAHLGKASVRDAGHVGQEIVRNAVGIFADES